MNWLLPPIESSSRQGFSGFLGGLADVSSTIKLEAVEKEVPAGLEHHEPA
jgi:hypothetical protein